VSTNLGPQETQVVVATRVSISRAAWVITVSVSAARPRRPVLSPPVVVATRVSISREEQETTAALVTLE
jgi:hypothetical protein